MVALDWVDLTTVTCGIFIGSVMCSIFKAHADFMSARFQNIRQLSCASDYLTSTKVGIMISANIR